jgi:cyclic pyranopterin phosphate synthase
MKQESLTHIDNEGKASMVDVSEKDIQEREAIAKGFISLQEETIRLIRENSMKKGDVLSVAEITGIMAAKKTSDLIPLCHQIPLSKVEVKCDVQDAGIKLTARAKCKGQTGVEMEALTAVSVSLLTIYDMCKAVDKTMIISDIQLVSKTKK